MEDGSEFSMTPATPPRSRGRRASNIDDEHGATFSSGISLETPKRQQQLSNPLTPLTTTAFKAPSSSSSTLLPSSVNKGVKANSRNSANICKTPEYTPNNKESTTRNVSGLNRVSRVLFPMAFQTEEKSYNLESHNVNDSKTDLLPPKRTASRPLLDVLTSSPIQDGETNFARLKLLKQDPGTPSDRLITQEDLDEWYVKESANMPLDSDDEKDEVYITKKISNPFESNDHIHNIKDSTFNNSSSSNNIFQDLETEEDNHAKLLKNNPDIEDTITYVNKKGAVVQQRKLTDLEKQRFKPKRLFSTELQNLNNNSK
ncbi:hypothetical protein TBLA_0C00310 [Henningerozyma blattae CBS 6284]|uniref:Uncharacterized protein n=1 Tax=Henningerozyma blattae (strain ATCC 34711 / CBS 6284 / DSM 70876 / NBRC 10599 / NRRL Y-10934 / UCD 77-7) TaxID=1071380 RepID=I2H0E6_HENB6|nr:hypothetical protein TBLA_0C00310 [Tetrapisispora blattae CBS 6284]CCH59848.1 hypothetical protein TBLA_0C00310 [Tetrapisispora blattae CBS 6284]